MSFEELDKKIRDASDMHQPSYNEKAWTKMERMLNRHLPQKKEYKKRYFFWVIAFLVSTPLLMIWLSRDLPENKDGTHTRKENLLKTIPQAIPKESAANGNGKNISETLLGNAVSIPVKKPITGNITTIKTPKQKNSTGNFKTVDSHYPDHPIQSKSFQPDITNAFLRNKNILNPLKQSAVERMNGNILFDKNTLAKYYNNDLRADVPLIISPISNDDNFLGGKRSFAQKLFIAVSAGPSVSSVNMNNPGKLTTLYGGSIKYALNNKWTIGGGFFINKKIYAAGKDDYQPPAGYWTYYTDLLRVDADCDVYEIPLTISYSFKKTGKHEWLASTGISSYYMKKETYNYLYKNQAGQVLTREWSIENKNMHYFSVLSLSAGYRHHINDRISVLMEPNIKIPLKGVGYGKVKFYNAGTLITLQVKPFAKK
jgi:hypothetical protein